MLNIPETPEGVAALLLCLILDLEGAKDRAVPKDYVLGVFADCLRAARRITDAESWTVLH